MPLHVLAIAVPALAGLALQRLGVPLAAAICIAIALQAVMLLASARSTANRS